jgi:acyl-CoA synthetase (NDP forming)
MPPSRPLYRHAELDRLLNPRSIAIIGASPRPGAFGERVLANLVDYRGAIHLVNGRYTDIGGRPCVAAIGDVPDPVDCAVITVAREVVDELVEACIEAGVGGMIVFASGYAETGRAERIAQQDRLAARARAAGVPLIGPNCIGAVNHRLRSRITFMPYAAMPPPRPGAIGIVSQSGALGFSMEQAMQHGTAVSHVLTSGNSSDVDMADYVAFLADDPTCSAIALLFEGMADPARLIAACERAWAVNKPVVVCKIAVGRFGAEAAMSHTGSLAGSDAAYRAAFARAGVVLVENFEHLMETASFLAKAPPPKATGVAVLATSGGAAIMAADKAEAHGVPLPQPREAARIVLEARVPDFGSIRNPVDVTAQVMNDPASLPACADAMLDDPQYGAMILPSVFSGPLSGSRVPYYNALARRTGKPVINIWLAEWLEGPGAADFEADPKVMIFRSMDRAFATLAAWHWRAALRAQPPRIVKRLAPTGARQQAAAMLAAAGQVLTEREAKAAFALYGIPVVQESLVQTADEAVAVANYPVVVKVESPALPHKTEAGVIRLNLRNEAELRAAFDVVMDNARKATTDINGVLVQPMVPQGVEMMVGARVDPLFGPLIVVGLGGVFVELMQDSAVGLAPLTHAEARGLLDRLRGKALLAGFRGGAAVDLDALADVVVRVAEFADDHRDIVAEIDVNPLICAGSRIIAVDALIVTRAA